MLNEVLIVLNYKMHMLYWDFMSIHEKKVFFNIKDEKN